MFRVRQPMPRWFHITLGIGSILVLIAMYTYLAHKRQRARRVELARQVEAFDERIADLERRLQTGTGGQSGAVGGEAPQASLVRLQQQRERIAKEADTAVDQTVPTWHSLYRDGLLRVLTPQGLRRNEYWLWEDARATLGRLLAGLAVGVTLSVLLGLLMGSYAPLEAFFVPPLAFLAKIPPTAMLAVFFVLVGTSFKMYVAMIAFGILPTLAQAVYQSAQKDVPDAFIDKAYTLGASQIELIWNVTYKQILPRILDAIRLQIGPAMVVLVAAEWMVADQGFGYRLRLFYQRTDMTVVYLYCFLLGAIGLISDYLLIGLRRWLCPWFGE
jgi:NitT/TauT family transport system permease protein